MERERGREMPAPERANQRIRLRQSEISREIELAQVSSCTVERFRIWFYILGAIGVDFAFTACNFELLLNVGESRRLRFRI